MEQNPPPQFPSPEELKTKITEFMKQNFGDRVSVATFAEPEAAPAEEEEKPEKTDHEEFEFNLLPRDIKAQLDRFVIKQDEAKKVLAIAVCDHYNHANYLRRLQKQDATRAQEIEYIKQNVILVGPTGVGKTYLINTSPISSTCRLLRQTRRSSARPDTLAEMWKIWCANWCTRPTEI